MGRRKKNFDWMHLGLDRRTLERIDRVLWPEYKHRTDYVRNLIEKDLAKAERERGLPPLPKDDGQS
jgi:hypothetical protein